MQCDTMKNLLTQFPFWGEQPLLVDEANGKPETCGLFPLGVRVRFCREDVLGNVTLGLRQSFLLRRAAYAGEGSADWLLQLQDWLLRQPTEALSDFGRVPRLSVENGRLVSSKQPGTGIYELNIHVDYEKE